MESQVLSFFTHLFTSLPQSFALLPEAAVRVPLSRLLNSAHNVPEHESSYITPQGVPKIENLKLELAKCIRTILGILVTKPQFIELFFQPETLLLSSSSSPSSSSVSEEQNLEPRLRIFEILLEYLINPLCGVVAREGCLVMLMSIKNTNHLENRITRVMKELEDWIIFKSGFAETLV